MKSVRMRIFLGLFEDVFFEMRKNFQKKAWFLKKVFVKSFEVW